MKFHTRDYWFYLTSAVDPAEHPELEFIADEEDRQGVVAEFRKEQQRRGSWALFCCAFITICYFGWRTLLSIWPLNLVNPFLGVLLCYGLSSAVSTLILRVWGHKSFPVFIRKELRRRGIPVCMECGYNLQGQVEPRCPECGEPFDLKLLVESGARVAAPSAELPLCLKNTPSPRREILSNPVDRP